MEASLTELTKWLLTTYGAPGAIIGLLLWLVWTQNREHKAERGEWEKQKQELFDKLLLEGKENVSALKSSSATIAALTVSIDARNAVLEKVADAINTMTQLLEHNRAHFGDLGQRLERKIEEAVTLLRGGRA